ncbi:MAG: hypothetical protein J7507_16310 [Pseudoxanthomonas sp.]|nr:hypothetical protein [Pseudoxanthomonas sp.]
MAYSLAAARRSRGRLAPMASVPAHDPAGVSTATAPRTREKYAPVFAFGATRHRQEEIKRSSHLFTLLLHLLVDRVFTSNAPEKIMPSVSSLFVPP